MNYKQAVEEIKKFNHKRGWSQEPSDLAKSIVIEAAELLEHFQWDQTHGDTEKNWNEIADEAADVLWYLINFSYRSNINLLEAFENKLHKVKEKYPEKEFRNGHNHTFYMAQKNKYRKAK